jgi:hypothetical protein
MRSSHDHHRYPPVATAEEFGERIFGAVLGAQLIQAAYLGDRLGYYRVLAAEPLTSPGRTR